ncbi:YndM family protein [Rummeliibacillus sp. TYF-LIM-RU47]|uniref:YndM family protein n=1 Tax=unclassified Rummeliibacillus TaxID=2622809 RepID=UPI00123B1E48|nr:YndM family protein [Rummeliibacillus sp. TYF-LIM-RU47]
MEHVKAIFIKFVMIAVVLGIVLSGIYDGDIGNTILISVVLTIVAYVLGDLLIFRKASDNHEPNADQVKRNTIATISDAVLAFLVVWLMGRELFNNDVNIVQASLISAIIIAVGEWFFHKYLDRQVFEEKHHHVTT